MCPTGISQLDEALPWDVPLNHTGTSDYFNACSFGAASVPNNAFGFQAAHGGQAYIGIYLYTVGLSYREYASAPLLQPLVAGRKYFISVWVNLADISGYSTNALQFYFSTGPAFHNNSNTPMTQVSPQAAIPSTTYISNQGGWIQVSASFVAAGGEDHVTVGNFLSDLNTPLQAIGPQPQHSYIHLDDFFISLNNMPDTTICLGGCADLWARGDTGVTTIWTTTTSTVSLGTGNNITVCPTVTTDYIATWGNQADTIRVNVIRAPTNVNVGADTTICEGDSILLGSGIAPHPSYSYLWSPTGDTTPTITTLTAGNYQVVVSNVCGADSADLNLMVDPIPLPYLGNDTAICFGQSLLLDPNAGPFQYQWSTSATTPSITASTSGTYAVSVTNAGGCQRSDSMNLLVAQELLLSPSSTNISCFGAADGTATILVSGTGPFTYQWNAPGAPTTPTISGLAAGAYTVTVTDSVGCVQTAVVSVNEPAPMTLATAFTDESCALRADGSATVVVSGGVSPYAYVWSNGDLTAMADSLSPGSYAATVTDARGCLVSANISIGTREVIVNTSGLPAFCEGEGGDTLFAVASGGDAPHAYTWWCDSASIGNCGLDSMFDDDPLANPGTSGWYFVQATDATGCLSEVDSIFVEVLPKPIVDAGPDQYICGDSAPCVVLTPTITGAPGPYTYQWIPAPGLSDATILNPCARPDTTTIYALVVTGGNGCSSDFTTTDTLSTVTVHVAPTPIIDAGPDIHSCPGDSVTLQGVGFGAGPLYSYQWSPTTGMANHLGPTPKVAPPFTTTYTFAAVSNHCPAYGDDVTVFVHTQPTVDAGPNREVCLGAGVMLDAQAGGDSTATYNFAWSPAAQLEDPFAEDPVATPNVSTWYYVQATSSWGCESPLDSVLVTLLPTPLAEAGDPVGLCFGDTLTLDGSYYYTTTDSADVSGIYYAWHPGVELDDPTIPDPRAWPTQSGWYQLEVRTGPCQTYDSVFVTVFPEIGVSVASDTAVACQGDSIVLSASGGLGGTSFEWLPGTGLSQTTGTTTIAAPEQSTVYQVVATEGACSDTAEIALEILPRPEAAYFSSLDRGCAPLTVSFMQNSDHAVQFIWDFGDGSPISNAEFPVHTYANPGSYPVNLEVVAPGGCASRIQTIQVEVVEDAVAAFSTSPQLPAQLFLPESTVDFFNNSQNAVTFRWDFGDGRSSAERNPSHRYAEPGSYEVTLWAFNAEGCRSEVVQGPFVVLPPDLFIPNVFSPNGDGVNDVFRVEYGGSQPFQLQVLDRWGSLLHSSNNKTQGWNGHEQQGKPVPEGVYYCHVRVGKKEYTAAFTLVR